MVRLRLALRFNRWRLLAGAGAVAAAAAALPAAQGPRLWWAAGLLGLAPWLVLGRAAARASARFGAEAARGPGGAGLAAWELSLPAAVVVALALVGAQGQLAPALALAAWGLAGLAGADALDRRLGSGGAVWLIWLAVALGVWTAPLWLGPWFGRTALAPALASGAVGYHPAGMVLAAAGLPTLQDPVFYRWTLSGVVEANPIPWYRGATAWAVAAALGATAALWRTPLLPERRS